MTTDQPVRTAGRLSGDEAAGVLALADAAADEDGVFPLSEDVLLRVRHAGPADASGAAPPVHLLSETPHGLAGYAYLDESAGELVVHPRFRRRGHGTALLRAALAAAGPERAVRFWAHGDVPAARAFAERNGLTRARVLWQMRRTLTTQLPDAPLPPGVTLRHFRPAVDDQAWLAVNARAFADHPEQGRWTVEDLRLRAAEPWFDPAGFLLAVDIEDKLLGFHWTKVHPEAIGEVYVLGVDPRAHRRGLGAALTVAGLEYLAGRGLDTAMLYVDESNRAAVRLYRGLGFEIWSTDVSYQKPR
jgi:mycothiol synthase